MRLHKHPHKDTAAGNIVSFSRYAKKLRQRVIRICPENDGLELLYSNQRHPGTFFTVKILCWALQDNGDVVAVIPWLNRVTTAPELKDPDEALFEGYRTPGSDYMFNEAPEHKVQELKTALEFFGQDARTDGKIVQEIPDSIGTHALLVEDGWRTLRLQEIQRWQLDTEGKLTPLTQTETAPGDGIRVDEQPAFRYYFQQEVARKVRQKDPETLVAIASLMQRQTPDDETEQQH